MTHLELISYMAMVFIYIGLGIAAHLLYYKYEEGYKDTVSPFSKFLEITLWPLGLTVFCLTKPFRLTSAIIKNAEKRIDKGRTK